MVGRRGKASWFVKLAVPRKMVATAEKSKIKEDYRDTLELGGITLVQNKTWFWQSFKPDTIHLHIRLSQSISYWIGACLGMYLCVWSKPLNFFLIIFKFNLWPFFLESLEIFFLLLFHYEVKVYLLEFYTDYHFNVYIYKLYYFWTFNWTFSLSAADNYLFPWNGLQGFCPFNQFISYCYKEALTLPFKDETLDEWSKWK